MAVTKKVKVVALREFTYGTRRMVAGDQVEMMPMEARTLAALGKARAVTEADRKAKPSVHPEQKHTGEPVRSQTQSEAKEAATEAAPTTTVAPPEPTVKKPEAKETKK